MPRPKIILATTNSSKIEPFMYSWNKSGLADEYEILTFKDIQKPDFEVEENTNSFENDALKKALEYSKHLDLPTISLDRGIEIPSLNNWPGTNSKDVFLGMSDETKHFIDQQKSDKDIAIEICNYVLSKIQDAGRVVNSVYGIAVALPDGKSASDLVTFSGKASKSLFIGNAGWNYDWFFIPDSLDSTLSALTEEEYIKFTGTYMWPITNKIAEFIRNSIL